MRAHDVAIGLAVAWARRRGCDAGVLLNRALYVSGNDNLVRVWGTRYWVGTTHVIAPRKIDRGPVVEPMPYTDARVAFGIAMAKSGPWSWCSPGCQRNGQNDATALHVMDHGSVVHVLHHSTRVDGCFPLDPRRWPLTSS
mgnify:FL=1